MSTQSSLPRERDADLPADVKRLRQRHVTMIALGGVIGASLFVGSNSVIRAVGPAAILSYALGGLLVVLVMRMLGEMATSRPAVGSFMEYARIGLGPWAGYSIGWLYWYYWVGVLAFEAVVAGKILGGWMPAVPQPVFAVIALAILAATNLISLRSFGETEFWLASIKVAAIIVFLLVGTLFVLGIWPNAHGSVSNLWDAGFAPHGGWAILSGVAVVIFSYFGTEIATMAGAESDNPSEGILKATRSVIWRIMLFYVGGVTLLVMITRWDQYGPDTKPFAHAFDLFGLPGAAEVMNAVVLTAAISVLNSGLYSGSRMLASLSHKGFAPAAVGRKNGNGVPALGVIATSVVVLAIIAVNYVMPAGVFDFIMNSAGAIALLVYLFIAWTQLKLRGRMTPDQVANLKIRMWLHPWLAILTIALVVGVIAVMLLAGEASLQQVLMSLGCFLLVLVLWPLVFSRGKASGRISPATSMFGVDPTDAAIVPVTAAGASVAVGGVADGSTSSAPTSTHR